MPTRWETFPVKLSGGLVSDISRLQQGMEAPGSARQLINFEPSLKGGYRRINGYNKYTENIIPAYGNVRVQGSGQSGTSLLVANIFASPAVGDTFTIAGVTGTYTVSAVTFSAEDNDATLTITPTLASSPADKAIVTFTNNNNKVQGVWVGGLNGELEVIAVRGGVAYKEDSGWTSISTPDYGTTLVHNSGQTGTTLTIDGVDDDDFGPTVGDTFTVAGIEKVYTVKATGTISGGQVTLTIDPALASSPANDAAVTFLSSRLRTNGNKVRFERFDFDGTERVVMVDGSSYPHTYDGTAWNPINGSSDVVGASHVVEFRQHLFFAVGSLLVFTEPFKQNGFDTGTGSGSIRLPADITGLIVFREQLIVFTQNSIHNISGTSVSDFVLSDISKSLGCVEPDTIVEIGGDIVYMGPDGIRYLGATERIGDFNLALASKNIRTNITSFLGDWSTFHAIPVRAKSQYRIFGYNLGLSQENGRGYLATQYVDQNVDNLQWAEIRGIPVYCGSSNYFNSIEYVLFANEDGYVYRLEQGSSFDGADIQAQFSTPYMSLNDPSYRKTIYRLHTYFDPEAEVSGTVNLEFDFKAPEKIQPPTKDLTLGGSFALYGQAIYGVSRYGGFPDTISKVPMTGAGFQVSVIYEFTGTDSPFIIDTLVLEYATEERM